MEYSYIDFEFLILGEKVLNYENEDKDSYEEFNDYQLSRLMIANEQNMKFYG